MKRVIVPAFVIIAAITAIITGCATPNELRQRTPDLNLESNLDAKTVAICITDKWEDGGEMGSLPVQMRETKTGYTIVLARDGNTLLVADVAKNNEGSKTVLFSRALLIDRFIEDVKACQTKER